MIFQYFPILPSQIQKKIFLHLIGLFFVIFLCNNCPQVLFIGKFCPPELLCNIAQIAFDLDYLRDQMTITEVGHFLISS
jgi:hypothetical protein